MKKKEKRKRHKSATTTRRERWRQKRKVDTVYDDDAKTRHLNRLVTAARVALGAAWVVVVTHSSILILGFPELNNDRSKIDEAWRREATTRVGTDRDEEEEKEEKAVATAQVTVAEERRRKRKRGGGMMATTVGKKKGARLEFPHVLPLAL
ncbi:hypothetical protein PIB30_038628 [Stylosanthes scabra]|uniref:Transmembrane protein n=1 Tax=Stylosanthes scabra TaxID=79078 RepID=A0ABU6UG13_9FABA|nr:hypothetical protein [Stylosanthes scabra]